MSDSAKIYFDNRGLCLTIAEYGQEKWQTGLKDILGEKGYAVRFVIIPPTIRDHSRSHRPADYMIVTWEGDDESDSADESE